MHTFHRLLLVLGLCGLPTGAAHAVLSGNIQARLVITNACEVSRSNAPLISRDSFAVQCGASANSAGQFIVSTHLLSTDASGDRVAVTLAW